MRLLDRIRNKFREPTDLVFALRIGAFMWRVPKLMRPMKLEDLLDRVRDARRTTKGDVARDIERIIRLRSPWFRLPMLAPYNTCFMRALTLYRFLDASQRDLRLHFVIEPERSPGDRLRSHAWVTVDGEVVEEPDLRESGQVHEIYVHVAPP